MSTTPPADDRLDFKQILPIFVIVLIDLLGLTIIIPLLPLYATSFGASPAVIGVLGATYPVMQFIGAPLLGRLSDRYGRKPILVVSQIGTFAGFLLLGFAHSLPLLFISRLIDGISGANIATAIPWRATSARSSPSPSTSMPQASSARSLPMTRSPQRPKRKLDELMPAPIASVSW